MKYSCKVCDYETERYSNYYYHKKSNKHITKIQEKENIPKQINPSTRVSLHKDTSKCRLVNTKYNCKSCDFETKHKSSFYRHSKVCDNNDMIAQSNNLEKEVNEMKNKVFEMNNKVSILEQEKYLIQREKNMFEIVAKEKSELLKMFMENSNTIINKVNDNSKVTTEAMQNVSISALKYAKEKFSDAPALITFDNIKIHDLDENKEDEKLKLIQTILYHTRIGALDKLLGDHIIKNLKKDKPEEQSFHTTDCSRLNYIVKEILNDVDQWNIDKNGVAVCNYIIKPLIKKCFDLLRTFQQKIMDEFAKGNFENKDHVPVILGLFIKEDDGSLQDDINKYIAPTFNLKK
jgi:hypothetical protein